MPAQLTRCAKVERVNNSGRRVGARRRFLGHMNLCLHAVGGHFQRKVECLNAILEFEQLPDNQNIIEHPNGRELLFDRGFRAGWTICEAGPTDSLPT